MADAIEKSKGVVDLKNGIENTMSGPAADIQGGSIRCGKGWFHRRRSLHRRHRRFEGVTSPNPLIASDRSYNIRVRLPDQTALLLRP